MRKPLIWRQLALREGRATLLAETSEGEWRIKPNRHGEPAPIGFNLRDGRDYFTIRAAREAEDPIPGSETHYRYLSLLGLGSDEHGYADTQEDAVALIEALLHGDATGSVEQLLADAGFTFQHHIQRATDSLAVYGRRVGRAFFQITISPTAIHLTFEKAGWTHWENLARFNLRFHTDNDATVPVFWPQRVMDNFPILTMRACLAMVERYIADGRHTRRAVRR